jgi:hypothetical protein
MSKDDNYYVDELPPARRERGCFFYGCIFALILAALIVITLGILAYVGYRFVSRTIVQYTDTAPMALPAPTLPEEEVQALKGRVDAFRKAVDEGQDATLTMTGEELNALINSDPDFQGRVAVDIEGDQLKGQVSIPFHFPGLGQRYANGKASLKASIDDGLLIVRMQDFEIPGRPLPKQVLDQFRAENLAKNAYDDPEQAETLRKIEKLEVKDGKITIHARPPSDEEADDEPKAEPAEEKAPAEPAEPVEEKAPTDPAEPKAEPGLIGDFPPEAPEPPPTPEVPERP